MTGVVSLAEAAGFSSNNGCWSVLARPSPIRHTGSTKRKSGLRRSADPHHSGLIFPQRRLPSARKVNAHQSSAGNDGRLRPSAPEEALDLFRFSCGIEYARTRCGIPGEEDGAQIPKLELIRRSAMILRLTLPLTMLDSPGMMTLPTCSLCHESAPSRSRCPGCGRQC